MARTKLVGEERMQAKLRKLATKFPDKIRGVLRFHAELIMTDSKNHFVPVDLGALKSSGFVDQPTRGSGREISIDLFYGGPSAPYAIVQHEDLSLNHTTGSAEYLKRPLEAAIPNLARNMARDLNIEPMV